MGGSCCCGRLWGGFEVNDNIEGKDHESHSDMKRLGLTWNEINTFHKAFAKIDKKKQDSFAITELLTFLKIDAVPLTVQAFGELDLSTDGMLNFREFTLSAWIFCARRREGLSDMAFAMYDKNNSGDLSSKEICTMIKDCYGQVSEANNVWAILESFDSDGDSKVSRNEFVVMCKKHPALLQPAINFQKQLMALISKKKQFWNNIYVTSSRTIHSKKVKMMFRVPDKIDSVKSSLVLNYQSRADETSHVKGFSHDNNLGVAIKPSIGKRRGKDKWNVDKSALKLPKKKNQVIVTNHREYGLFG